jgi:hypothetical protein
MMVEAAFVAYYAVETKGKSVQEIRELTKM